MVENSSFFGVCGKTQLSCFPPVGWVLSHARIANNGQTFMQYRAIEYLIENVYGAKRRNERYWHIKSFPFSTCRGCCCCCCCCCSCRQNKVKKKPLKVFPSWRLMWSQFLWRKKNVSASFILRSTFVLIQFLQRLACVSEVAWQWWWIRRQRIGLLLLKV